MKQRVRRGADDNWMIKSQTSFCLYAIRILDEVVDELWRRYQSTYTSAKGTFAIVASKQKGKSIVLPLSLPLTLFASRSQIKSRNTQAHLSSLGGFLSDIR